MNLDLLIGCIVWITLAVFFSAFIIYFDRKKFSTPQLGFYYLAMFFISGVLLLAVTLTS